MLKRLLILSALVFGLFIVSSSAQQIGNPKSDANRTKAPNQDQRDKGAARTEQSGQNGNKKFAEMDRDHDGYISREEWTRNSKAFDRMDTNNDQRISKQEMESAKKGDGNSENGKGNKQKPSERLGL